MCVYICVYIYIYIHTFQEGSFVDMFQGSSGGWATGRCSKRHEGTGSIRFSSEN